MLLRVDRQALKAAFDVLSFTLVKRAVALHWRRYAIRISRHWQLPLLLLLHATFRAKPGARSMVKIEEVVISCGRQCAGAWKQRGHFKVSFESANRCRADGGSLTGPP